MSWYYTESTNRKGPVGDDEFEALVRAGKITGGTLVWREGMAEWQPYSAIGGATADSVRGMMVGCVECGRAQSSNEMIRYEGRFVCASCKDLFFQRIREGSAAVASPGNLQYAGFWIRFGARFLDAIIMQIVGYVVGLAVGSVGSESAQLIAALGGVAIGLGYEIFFIGKFGATPGKMACKIKVVRPDGSPVGFGVAIGRYFAQILSSLILLIGYLMAAWDPEKRSLHDRICGTRVIRTND